MDLKLELVIATVWSSQESQDLKAYGVRVFRVALTVYGAHKEVGKHNICT